ncbi:MAG TPA: hypothetical protein VIJ78_03410 [Pseudolabrys sp.]|nr:hypothetical protein [Pseudolabrys sp.]
MLRLIDGGVADQDGITTDIPESYGWGDLKKQIKILSTADAEKAMPFIEAAYRRRATIAR